MLFQLEGGQKDFFRYGTFSDGIHTSPHANREDMPALDSLIVPSRGGSQCDLPESERTAEVVRQRTRYNRGAWRSDRPVLVQDPACTAIVRFQQSITQPVRCKFGVVLQVLRSPQPEDAADQNHDGDEAERPAQVGHAGDAPIRVGEAASPSKWMTKMFRAKPAHAAGDE